MDGALNRSGDWIHCFGVNKRPIPVEKVFGFKNIIQFMTEAIIDLSPFCQ